MRSLLDEAMHDGLYQPTVADCLYLRLYVPSWMAECEVELGADTLVDFLREFGGGSLYIPKTMSSAKQEANPVLNWLRLNVQTDYFRVALGPVAYGHRRSWTIHQLLNEGHSGLTIARRLGISHEAVQRTKRVLRDQGLLKPLIQSSKDTTCS